MWDTVGLIFKVLIGCVAFLAFARLLFVDVIPQLREGSIQSDVSKKGVATEANIIAAEQTTYWGGNKPIYKLTFRYSTNDGHEFESSLTKALTHEEIEKYKAGNFTSIKYDSKKPHNIALYDKPLILDGN